MKAQEIDFEQELYKRFGMVKDFTLGMRIAQAFYDLGCTRTAERYDEIEYNRQRANESEKQMNQDKLEEEIQSFWNRASGFQPKFATLEVKENGFAVIARHFAQWGAEHLATSGKTSNPNDLEEAAKDYAYNEGYQDPEYYNIVETFIAAAKWDREQMLKEAVEGEIMYNPYPTICLDDCKDYNFKDNQKVRIIIVKEDEK